MSGGATEWGHVEHLLASVLDALHGANWQRGGGRSQRPQPVKRPQAAPARSRTRMSKAELDEALSRVGW